MLNLNCDGLPTPEHSLKMEELASNMRKHHVISLTETRTNDLDRLSRFLPHHTLLERQIFLMRAMAERGLEWLFWQLQTSPSSSRSLVYQNTLTVYGQNAGRVYLEQTGI